MRIGMEQPQNYVIFFSVGPGRVGPATPGNVPPIRP